MPSAALLVIGSEMLDPDRRDANGPVARAGLAALGIPLRMVVRVEDTVQAIASAVRAALSTNDIVVASGGLGPTGDDLTREGTAAALGCGVHLDEAWAATIAARLAARGRELTEIGRRQALVVDGAETLANPKGLACGSLVASGGRIIALLPGVPTEFRAMLEGAVLPRVATLFPDRPQARLVRGIAAGIPEALAEPTLLPWYRRPGVAVSILPVSGVLRITFTLTSPPAGDLDALEAEVRAAMAEGLAGHLVSLDGRLPEEIVGEALVARGATLSVAESCTGGALARRLVSVPGASRYFVGGVEAYADRIKERLLGVPGEILATHGAVSVQTVAAMADGARATFGTTYGVATTGIAGPAGGTPDKPVGLVHVAVAGPEGRRLGRISFPLERAVIMEIAANYALYELWRLLEGDAGDA